MAPPRSRVVQGYFPQGIPRIVLTPPPQLARPGLPGPRVAPQAVQPKSGPPGHAHGSATALPAHGVNLASAGGQRLPEAVQAKMEAAFKTSFSDVRVHTGPQAAAIGALAFTHGSDLYFAPGQYNPQTPQGQQLLAHELAHVVQQKEGRVRNPFGTGIAVVHDVMLEAEAERLGRSAMMYRGASPATQAKPLQAKMRLGAEPSSAPIARTSLSGAIQMLVSDNAKERINTVLSAANFGNYDTEMAKLQPEQRKTITDHWDAHGQGRSSNRRGVAARWMAAKIIEYLRAGVITYSNNFDTKHTSAVITASSARDAGNNRIPKPAFNTVLKTSYLVNKIITHAATQADGARSFTERASTAGAANISLAELDVADQTMRTIALGIYQYTASYTKATNATNQTVTLDLYHLATA